MNKVQKSFTNKTSYGQRGTKNTDEFYTPYDSVYKELSFWGDIGKFRNKNIICPCDLFVENEKQFFSYTISRDNALLNTVVKKMGTKTLLWDSSIDEHRDVESITQEELLSIIQNKEIRMHNFPKVLYDNFEEWGIKSITVSGYNPNERCGIPFQDIDYSEYDVCITNPPFSIIGEFLNQVIGNIEFICLSPYLTRLSPIIAEPLMDKKIYLGYNRCHHISFYDYKNNKNKRVNCDWLTSFQEGQVQYSKNIKKTDFSYYEHQGEYPVMINMVMKDGSNPIKVSSATIPYDYNDWMFGSIDTMEKIDLDKYEWYSCECRKYLNQKHPEKNPFSHKLCHGMYIDKNGKRCFAGIIFRKKVN